MTPDEIHERSVYAGPGPWDRRFVQYLAHVLADGGRHTTVHYIGVNKDRTEFRFSSCRLATFARWAKEEIA